MFNQIILVLILETIFFVVFHVFRDMVSKMTGRRVCATCSAVSSAWLVLLLVKYLQYYPVDKYLIAILLGQSVAGISARADEFLENSKLKIAPPVLKFLIILYGTFSVLFYAFINGFFGLIIFAPVFVLGFFSLTPISKQLKSTHLSEKLKNCC